MRQPKGILTWCFPWLTPLLIGLAVGYHVASIVHNPQSTVRGENVSELSQR